MTEEEKQAEPTVTQADQIPGDEDDAQRALLGASSLLIADKLRPMFPSAQKFSSEIIGTALFVLADAGIIGFVGEDNKETNDVDLVGLKFLSPEESHADRRSTDLQERGRDETGENGDRPEI